MTFDDITGDRKLWAVHFEGEDDNELYKVFNNWADVVWLRAFFKENIDDLNAYFKITDIKEAISDTIEDSERLRYIIMDISPETDLSKIFRPLDNNQASDVMLQKEKARLKRKYGHSSWLRLYAIKLIQGNYIITGGAIKLTATRFVKTFWAKKWGILIKKESASLDFTELKIPRDYILDWRKKFEKNETTFFICLNLRNCFWCTECLCQGHEESPFCGRRASDGRGNTENFARGRSRHRGGMRQNFKARIYNQKQYLYAGVGGECRCN